MMNRSFEELAKLYGIEINNVESGKGGLFHIDSNKTKIELNNIFISNDYITPTHEIISFLECESYSIYENTESLMLAAA